MTRSTRIAFIGLGNMGAPMALNLHRAGFSVTAFDLSTEALARVRSEGVATADTVRAAVDGAGIVISMLPNSRHVESLFLGTEGLLTQLPQGALIIDCSTIAPA
ncbi:MAG TPA: 3-hydroxyisobutyrate dehydrogenase, partial [Cupriavidus sp.]|nr:3-hydroxyisobutyrate dehydrogenase [Cupriavidus sp.]